MHDKDIAYMQRKRWRRRGRPASAAWLRLAVALLAVCSAASRTAHAQASPPASPAAAVEVEVTVLGVAVPYSMFGIVKRLEQIPGVAHVSFNLLHGVADVWINPGATVTDDALREAVLDADYTPGPIRRLPQPNY